MPSKSAAHGTRAMYRAGCKDGVGGRPCVKCRKWKADDTAKYRASNGGSTTGKRAPKRARPTSSARPTDSEPTTNRRPSSGDTLAQIIEQAIWDAKGDEATASVVAAAAVRAAGYRRVLDGPVEAAAREALGEPSSAAERERFEAVFRTARVLDDPETNARSIKGAVEAYRIARADTKTDGSADDAAAIMDAIRSAAGS
jgi:hypothetical protein